MAFETHEIEEHLDASQETDRAVAPPSGLGMALLNNLCIHSTIRQIIRLESRQGDFKDKNEVTSVEAGQRLRLQELSLQLNSSFWRYSVFGAGELSGSYGKVE